MMGISGRIHGKSASWYSRLSGGGGDGDLEKEEIEVCRRRENSKGIYSDGGGADGGGNGENIGSDQASQTSLYH